tara:strand:- start:703 stop:1050 length:348 start_codon:yes stop_codon:yes gene_type:complete
MQETIDAIKLILSPLTERGKGSSPEDLMSACVRLHNLETPLSENYNLETHLSENHNSMPAHEQSLRRSVCLLLINEAHALGASDDYVEQIGRYLQVIKWAIRLGRVLTTEREYKR